MKILLPYSLSLGRRFNDPVIKFGIEKFCHSINDTFDDVHVLEIEDDSNIIDSDKIKQTALKNNCDLIICNWNKGCMLVLKCGVVQFLFFLYVMVIMQCVYSSKIF